VVSGSASEIAEDTRYEKGLREPFYEEDERIRGAVKAAKFRKFEVAIKYT
jgi:hypothetical protein